jgi:hypothetical protein
MKINEIISEGKLRKAAELALPNLRKYDNLDNSSPYHAYRFGIALAGAPAMGTDKDGPIGQKMVTIGYTEADDDITQAAAKLIGATSTQISTNGSKELPWVNKESPVAKPKKNKYGV